MGKEAHCTAHFREEVSEGKALLESDALTFRGDFRLSIRLAEVTSVSAENGQLMVTTPEGRATFELGPQAEKWAQAIRSPKGLMDKLGVKPGYRVSVLGITDEPFRVQLRQRTADVSEGEPQAGSDAIFLLADSKEDLKRLGPLQAYVKKDGDIWIVAPKGVPHIKESDVLAAGREAGLVDVKVVSFSATYTAHKFVIPKARR